MMDGDGSEVSLLCPKDAAHIYAMACAYHVFESHNMLLGDFEKSR